MSLEDLRANWDAFGRTDPMWAILTDPRKKGGKWLAEDFFATGVREIADVMAWARSVGLPVSKKKALDFGCGIGRLTQALGDYFQEVHGIDVAQSMIDLANRYNRHGERCVYHLNKNDSLAMFADNTFDLVYSRLTLQHIEPEFSKRYIAEFVRVLSPSGFLMFHVLSGLRNADSMRQRIKRALPATVLALYRRIRFGGRPVMWMHGVRREEVISILRQRGANVIDVVEDEDTDRSWVGYRYRATKP